MSSHLPSPFAPKFITLKTWDPFSGGRDGGCTFGGGEITGELLSSAFGGVFCFGFGLGLDFWWWLLLLLWELWWLFPWLFGFLLDKESDKSEELRWLCLQCLPLLAMQVSRVTDQTKTAINITIVMLLSLRPFLIIMFLWVCFYV